MSSPPTTNLSLADEIEAISAIFEADTIEVVSSDSSSTIIHLKPPSQPFTFRLSFGTEYPDLPPSIDGTASTGDTEKGAGDVAVNILAEVLGNVYSPGQVCLFELISDVGPLLEERYGAHPEAPSAKREESRSEQPTGEYRGPALITGQDTAFLAPKWITSEPLSVMKSTFIAHAAPCSSKDEALSHISNLISSSKKIVSATHNITAYRIKWSPSTYIQDCDDDGESAAGGRLLHLLQLMECENVVVVVTRWYGGVKLGGERFRCIGNVAREVLVKGGWGKDAKGGKK
jgi:Uncharacterized protein family UPF0029/RWD domain